MFTIEQARALPEKQPRSGVYFLWRGEELRAPWPLRNPLTNRTFPGYLSRFTAVFGQICTVFSVGTVQP